MARYPYVVWGLKHKGEQTMATKFEAFSFTPSTSGNTLFLDDETLIPDFIFFQVCKNGANVNGSTGFSDGTKNRAKYCLNDTIKDSGRSTSYSVYHKKDVSNTPTIAVAGKPATGWNANAGEFVMEFDTADTAYTIDGYIIGH